MRGLSQFLCLLAVTGWVDGEPLFRRRDDTDTTSTTVVEPTITKVISLIFASGSTTISDSSFSSSSSPSSSSSSATASSPSFSSASPSASPSPPTPSPSPSSTSFDDLYTVTQTITFTNLDTTVTVTRTGTIQVGPPPGVDPLNGDRCQYFGIGCPSSQPPPTGSLASLSNADLSKGIEDCKKTFKSEPFTTTVVKSDSTITTILPYNPATPNCCGACSLTYSKVDVYYFPPADWKNGSNCIADPGFSSAFATFSTPPPPVFTPPGVDIQPRALEGSTLVNADGFTFVSPSVYVGFKSVYARDNCGGVGQMHTSFTVPFAPGELYTQFLPLGFGKPAFTSYPFDPHNITCYSRPVIAFPTKLLDVDPAWYSCTAADNWQGDDPPFALTPRAGLGGADPHSPPPSPMTSSPVMSAIILTTQPVMITTQLPIPGPVVDPQPTSTQSPILTLLPGGGLGTGDPPPSQPTPQDPQSDPKPADPAPKPANPVPKPADPASKPADPAPKPDSPPQDPQAAKPQPQQPQPQQVAPQPQNPSSPQQQPASILSLVTNSFITTTISSKPEVIPVLSLAPIPQPPAPAPSALDPAVPLGPIILSGFSDGSSVTVSVDPAHPSAIVHTLSDGEVITIDPAPYILSSAVSPAPPAGPGTPLPPSAGYPTPGPAAPSAAPEVVVVEPGETVTQGGATITISGQPVYLGSSGLVIGTETTVLVVPGETSAVGPGAGGVGGSGTGTGIVVQPFPGEAGRKKVEIEILVGGILAAFMGVTGLL